MAKIITIAQQKGGAGKTTLAAHLGVYLAQIGNKVKLIDIDPQSSLTFWYNLRKKKFGEKLIKVDFAAGAGWRLGNLTTDKENFDYLVIDSPPHTEMESKTAIRMADMVLVPLQPSPTDLWATSLTTEFTRSEKKLTRLVLNRCNQSAVMTKKITPELVNLLQTYLGNRVAFSNCLVKGMCVTETEPHSIAAQEIKSLTKEVLDLLTTRNETKYDVKNN
ncbi:MAG: AAA family ATPase [Janthinobacterium lividum]